MFLGWNTSYLELWGIVDDQTRAEYFRHRRYLRWRICDEEYRSIDDVDAFDNRPACKCTPG